MRFRHLLLASVTFLAVPPMVAADVAVPAGTVLTVRTADALSSTGKGGQKFGFTVDKPVAIGSKVAIPAGTKGYGLVVGAKQAGRVAGKSTLAVTLTELVIGSRTIALQTNTLEDTGQGSGRKVVRGAAAGAAIGAIAGDTGKGAAIGATAGAAKKGQSVGIPAGSLLEFTLGAQVLVP